MFRSTYDRIAGVALPLLEHMLDPLMDATTVPFESLIRGKHQGRDLPRISFVHAISFSMEDGASHIF